MPGEAPDPVRDQGSNDVRLEEGPQETAPGAVGRQGADPISQRSNVGSIAWVVGLGDLVGESASLRFLGPVDLAGRLNPFGDRVAGLARGLGG